MNPQLFLDLLNSRYDKLHPHWVLNGRTNPELNARFAELVFIIQAFTGWNPGLKRIHKIEDICNDK